MEASTSNRSNNTARRDLDRRDFYITEAHRLRRTTIRNIACKLTARLRGQKPRHGRVGSQASPAAA